MEPAEPGGSSESLVTDLAALLGAIGHGSNRALFTTFGSGGLLFSQLQYLLELRQQLVLILAVGQ
jgi:hypothetical protein